MDRDADTEQKQGDSPYANSCSIDKVPQTPLLESDPLSQETDKEEEAVPNEV